jgi:hypothetical protein
LCGPQATRMLSSLDNLALMQTSELSNLKIRYREIWIFFKLMYNEHETLSIDVPPQSDTMIPPY